NDESRVDALGAQGSKSGLADRMLRQAGDVAAGETEMREARGDIRFTAAEGRRQHGRLKKSLEAGRAQPQHDLPERDAGGAHCRGSTLARTRRAFSVITANSPRSIAPASTSADPMPTATAPARIHSPALSIVTPPVGISFTCGSGARTSRMN